MAKLFITYGGKKYEQKFRHGAAYFVDQRGQVVAGSTAKAIQEATRVPTSARHAVELTESVARARSRVARQGKPNSVQISEADRLRRRRDLYMGAGMNFSEANIAARGRYERG
jgi:hypothetical protein